jgi:hypothetical protein
LWVEVCEVFRVSYEGVEERFVVVVFFDGAVDEALRAEGVRHVGVVDGYGGRLAK